MHQLKTRYKNLLFAYLSVSLFAISPAIFAKAPTPDEEQPVHISANSLDAQEKKGISIYKGNVIVTQGSLTLTGDVIRVKHPNGQLQSVKASGRPASFKRFSQIDQAWLKGQASSIEYNALKKTVLLVGNAQVEQPGQHLITGPELFYDMIQKTLKAQGTSQEKGRVSVTFNPVNNTPKNTEKEATKPVSSNKPTPLPTKK